MMSTDTDSGSTGQDAGGSPLDVFAPISDAEEEEEEEEEEEQIKSCGQQARSSSPTFSHVPGTGDQGAERQCTYPQCRCGPPLQVKQCAECKVNWSHHLCQIDEESRLGQESIVRLCFACVRRKAGQPLADALPATVDPVPSRSDSSQRTSGPLPQPTRTFPPQNPPPPFASSAATCRR